MLTLVASAPDLEKLEKQQFESKIIIKSRYTLMKLLAALSNYFLDEQVNQLEILDTTSQSKVITMQNRHRNANLQYKKYITKQIYKNGTIHITV